MSQNGGVDKINEDRLREIVKSLGEMSEIEKALKEKIKLLQKRVELESQNIGEEFFLKAYEWIAGDPVLAASLTFIKKRRIAVVITSRVMTPSGIEMGKNNTLWIAHDVHHDSLYRFLGLPPLQK